MIRWPIRSARAISKLFSPIQDIDIFVEDQGDEQFYTMLFKRAAPEGVTISRVVALGGCASVKSAARDYNGLRPALFLIDGDFPWVRGEDPPSISRLYRLECYCVENLLLNQRLVCAVSAEELMCDPADAERALRYAQWRKGAEVLIPLFARLAVLNQIAPEMVTTGAGYSKLVIADGEHNLPRLCERKVAEKIAEVDALIIDRVGRDKAVDLVSEIEGRISSLPEKLLVVSGKDFLLPLLYFFVKNATGTRITMAQFRYRLASSSAYDDIPELRRALAVAA